MTPQQQILLTLAQYAIKFGLEAAIKLAMLLRSGADIDAAIAALEAAESKTAQQYFDEGEARKALNPVIVPDAAILVPVPPDQAP